MMNKTGCKLCEYTGFAYGNIPCACSESIPAVQTLKIERTFVTETLTYKGDDLVRVSEIDMWPHWISDGSVEKFKSEHGCQPTHVRIHPDHIPGLIRRLSDEHLTLEEFEGNIRMKILEGQKKNTMIFEAPVT